MKPAPTLPPLPVKTATRKPYAVVMGQEAYLALGEEAQSKGIAVSVDLRANPDFIEWHYSKHESNYASR